MTAICFRFLLTIVWELVILVWQFYMLKSNIDVFFVTSFLCSLKFLLFYRIEYHKRCIEYNPIGILYKFQIDISSNSWEIKYQNIGRTHTHTDTHTDRQTDRVKTIPRNPLRGRGNEWVLKVQNILNEFGLYEFWINPDKLKEISDVNFKQMHKDKLANMYKINGWVSYKHLANLIISFSNAKESWPEMKLDQVWFYSKSLA